MNIIDEVHEFQKDLLVIKERYLKRYTRFSHERHLAYLYNIKMKYFRFMEVLYSVKDPFYFTLQNRLNEVYETSIKTDNINTYYLDKILRLSSVPAYNILNKEQ